MKILHVLSFTRTPGGRYKSDGPLSAEEFREKFLEPALRENDEQVNVNMDGIAGMARSFMEEAFGGIVRQMGSDVAERLSFTCEESKWRAEDAQSFVDDAVERAKKCQQ